MTTAQLAATRLNLNEARCEALFASGLQPSDAPTAEMVADAINYIVQQVGISGCVGQMAQEFGDHPEAASERMRWARQFAAWAGVRLQAGLRAEPRSRSTAPQWPTLVTARQPATGPERRPDGHHACQATMLKGELDM
jgi:hypothetical protein